MHNKGSIWKMKQESKKKKWVNTILRLLLISQNNKEHVACGPFVQQQNIHWQLWTDKTDPRCDNPNEKNHKEEQDT